jgi:hypothetical protein
MLSSMESDRDLAGVLRRADRAAAAPYIDYPPTPTWYPPAAGLWAALFCVAFAIPDDGPLRELSLLALVAVEVAFLLWYRRRRGTWPRGRAPEEIRKVLAAFMMGAAAVTGIIGATWWLTAPWVAAIVAFAVVTPAVTWYERVYAAAAARARTRLE